MKVIRDFMDFIQKFPQFIENHEKNPLLWIGLFLSLLLLVKLGMKSLGKK